MTNFRLLNQDEYDNVWNKFYNLFHFKPSTNHFPGISTKQPELKFDIKNCFSQDFPLDKLEEYALNLFTAISKPNDRLFALDWQHDCFDFDPREQMDRDEFGEWVVPVLPNGDYYIFLTKDLNNVWFGHPWEQTITLVGKDIVKQGQKLKPNFLN
ncbi:MAG TPA: DUF2716 domain-containing protein [Puia sp.]|nr:DUF2716 domain-containing protein [Puia sp.]